MTPKAVLVFSVASISALPLGSTLSPAKAFNKAPPVPAATADFSATVTGLLP
ncbi:MAG: hypothetical protein H7A55_00425 [Verrucomicrobiaceae bacterium]|nr:hypothetical protein [Verrucomicrobiaceae bacterium]